MNGVLNKLLLLLLLQTTNLTGTQYIYTVNDLLNARDVYSIFVLKGGRLIDTRRLLEGGIDFLSKVMHSNH